MDTERERVNFDVSKAVPASQHLLPLSHIDCIIDPITSHRTSGHSGEARPISGQGRPESMGTAPSPNSFPYSGPPEQFDVTTGLRDAIPLADGETSLWAADHAAFIKSAAGLDKANWIGVRPLGSGTFGIAGLWELRDENNVVIEVLSPFLIYSVIAKR